jgi:hypothetical protein
VAAATLMIVFGALLPLISRLPVTLARNSAYQQSNFRLADAILQPGDRYLAGVPILYRREQALPQQFNSLDRVERARLAAMSPGEMLSVIRQLNAVPTKLLILNYRMIGLPRLLDLYLSVTFEPYWGSVFIYSPKIGPGQFNLPFDGNYLVKSATPVSIDGVPVQGIVRLGRGSHIAAVSSPFRLSFRPQGIERWLDPRFRSYEEPFHSVYSF